MKYFLEVTFTLGGFSLLFFSERPPETGVVVLFLALVVAGLRDIMEHVTTNTSL